MNMFQDKRICFGNQTYQTRSFLAVCHWNENVDRAYTSVWNPPRPNAPRSKKKEKSVQGPNIQIQRRDLEETNGLTI